MPTPQHITDIVNRYLAAINAGDMHAVMDLYADNAAVEDPAGTEPKTGADILTFYQNAFSGGAKVELTDSIRISAETAAFPFRAEIGQGGGKVLIVEVIDIFEFDEAGKVEKMTAHFGPSNITMNEG
ncbi:nuclear transport factor 2 family protein [Sphingorhabdus sp. Alg231-15]|uniref:nuclear transport factor 2 family protein n=1 Tax=Sphingorhabdus sp. Alg231-15 TaxID=1922222 RepID=UPI000D559A65